MNDRTQVYLTKLQSLRRGIRHGWYVVDEDGNPCIGPFPTREACMDQIAPAMSNTPRASTSPANEKAASPTPR
jgi:hypothetical protein